MDLMCGNSLPARRVYEKLDTWDTGPEIAGEPRHGSRVDRSGHDDRRQTRRSTAQPAPRAPGDHPDAFAEVQFVAVCHALLHGAGEPRGRRAGEGQVVA